MTTLSQTLRELDTIRRNVGANTNKGVALSNVSEIVKAIPEADVAPNAPPRSTICAHTNLTTWLLPNATADLARVMGERT
jgi:hypothetical protein